MQGGTKAVEIVMNRLLMSAVADVSYCVRQTVLSALIETEDLDTYLAQAEWCALLYPQNSLMCSSFALSYQSHCIIERHTKTS